MMRSRKPTSFYGWHIAGLSVVTAGLTGPGQTIGVSVFIDHFAEDLNLGRSTIAICYLVGTLIAATTLTRWGRMIDRRGCRRATTIIAVVFSVAVAAMAGVTGVISLALGFLFIRMLGQGALSLASTVAVSLWFERRRGFVLGLVITGSGILMALVPIILNQGIEAWGWRMTWLVTAAVLITVLVPISWLGLVDRPSSIGQYVDGQAPVDPRPPGSNQPSEDSETATAVNDGWGVDRATAMRTGAFWMLALASGCVGALATALNFYQIVLLGEAGLSRSGAAAMFLPQVIGAAIAGIAAGALVDRYGTRLVPSVTMALMAITLGLAGMADGNRSVFVYAVALGVTVGVSRTATTTVVPVWFGTKHLGSVIGALVVAGVAGSAVGPLALSLTADVLGSWQAAVTVWAATPATIGFAALWTREPGFGGGSSISSVSGRSSGSR